MATSVIALDVFSWVNEDAGLGGWPEKSPTSAAAARAKPRVRTVDLPRALHRSGLWQRESPFTSRAMFGGSSRAMFAGLREGVNPGLDVPSEVCHAAGEAPTPRDPAHEATLLMCAKTYSVAMGHGNPVFHKLVAVSVAAALVRIRELAANGTLKALPATHRGTWVPRPPPPAKCFGTYGHWKNVISLFDIPPLSAINLSTTRGFAYGDPFNALASRGDRHKESLHIAAWESANSSRPRVSLALPSCCSKVSLGFVAHTDPHEVVQFQATLQSHTRNLTTRDHTRGRDGPAYRTRQFVTLERHNPKRPAGTLVIDGQFRTRKAMLEITDLVLHGCKMATQFRPRAEG